MPNSCICCSMLPQQVTIWPTYSCCPRYLEENVGALAVQLTAEDLNNLEAAVPPEKVVGDRYPDMKKMSYHYRKLAAAAH